MASRDFEEEPLLSEKPLLEVSSDENDDGKDFDKLYNGPAYWIMMLLGVGLLLPWNVCLNSLDYMGHNYSFNLAYYVTLAYVYPQLPLLAVMVKVRGALFFSGRCCLTVTLSPACRPPAVRQPHLLHRAHHCDVFLGGRSHAADGRLRTRELLHHVG